MAWIVRAPGLPEIQRTRVVPPAPENINNVGEWSALLEAVKEVAESDAHDGMVLHIRGDSQLVIYQLIGKWGCHKPSMALLCDKVRACLCDVTWRAEWIPREQNAEADALTEGAYQKATGKPFPKMYGRRSA